MSEIKCSFFLAHKIISGFFLFLENCTSKDLQIIVSRLSVIIDCSLTREIITSDKPHEASRDIRGGSKNSRR